MHELGCGQASQQALDAGIKDAWGNGLMTALTGYLDLGTGVLILWYGGYLVMHSNENNSNLTIGKLVTFQLYWNMMNNAYQSLQGLITSFTRAAAGAEKVFSLWDSIPDIQPNKGIPVDWQVSPYSHWSTRWCHPTHTGTHRYTRWCHCVCSGERRDHNQGC